MITVKYILTDPNAKVPTRVHEDDSGFDLSSIEDLIIKPGKFASVRTGVRVELPRRTELQIRPRSGLAVKYGVTTLLGVGTIDANYRGEMHVILINHGEEDFHVTIGMRIAQAIICPTYDVEFKKAVGFEESDRGANGLGSTGL